MRLLVHFLVAFAPTLAAAEWWRETGDVAPFVASLVGQAWLAALVFIVGRAVLEEGGVG